MDVRRLSHCWLGGLKWSPGEYVDKWSQNRITSLKIRIRIRIIVKNYTQIQIRIKVKSFIRIRREKVMRSRNPEYNFNCLFFNFLLISSS
jgi:hypothetical protein